MEDEELLSAVYLERTTNDDYTHPVTQPAWGDGIGCRPVQNRAAANRGFYNIGAQNRGFQYGSSIVNRGVDNLGVQNRGIQNVTSVSSVGIQRTVNQISSSGRHSSVPVGSANLLTASGTLQDSTTKYGQYSNPHASSTIPDQTRFRRPILYQSSAINHGSQWVSNPGGGAAIPTVFPGVGEGGIGRQPAVISGVSCPFCGGTNVHIHTADTSVNQPTGRPVSGTSAATANASTSATAESGVRKKVRYFVREYDVDSRSSVDEANLDLQYRRYLR